MNTTRAGQLYGIGVGPGDPELMTLKAHRLLSGATTIVYPAPDNGSSFARQIASDYIPKGVKEISIVIPMSPDRFPIKEIYDQAAKEIASILSAGEDVVVLCEGDPFFYGSFMYLYGRLKGQYECQVIPGVSSIMAGASVSGEPIASLNEVFTVAPGPLPEARLRELIDLSDSLVLSKVGRHFSKLYQVISDAGWLDHAVYLERVTLTEQRLMPLRDVDGDKMPYFSLIQLNKRDSTPL